MRTDLSHSNLVMVSDSQPHHKHCIELVIIDSRVPDLQTLLFGLKPNVGVWFVEQYQDPLETISAALAGHESLQTRHLITHGRPGVLVLGNSHI